MNEVARIHAKIDALLDARNYLLDQQPTDMVALSEVTERIVALTARLSAELANPSVGQLTPAQVQALQDAVNSLRRSILRSEAASQILRSITEILNA